MEKVLFVLNINRIRVDLGDDVFTDADTPSEPLIKASSLIELKKKIKTYVAGKGGEFVEFDNDSVCFDTNDLTIYATIEKVD